MKIGYTQESTLYEFILATIVICGIVAAELMQIQISEFLHVAGGAIIGFYFGKAGKTNGAYVAGKTRGYLQGQADNELGVNRKDTLDSVTETIEVKNG